MHSSRMRTVHCSGRLGAYTSQHALGRGCESQHALDGGCVSQHALGGGCLPGGVCHTHPPCEQNHRRL